MTEYKDVIGFICNLFTSFFNSMINIFNFRYANPEAKDYYYYFADRPCRYNSPDCPYNKKLGCLRLNILLYCSVVFIETLNLLSLSHWCFPEKFTKFLKKQKQPPEKVVLKKFAIITGKQLCWSLFIIKLQTFRHLPLGSFIKFR